VSDPAATTPPETTYTVPTTLRVSRTVNCSGTDKASESESEEIIEVKNFLTQPAVIQFSYPVKRALEYQSVGLEVGISLPCYVEEVHEAIEKAQEIVISRTKELMPDVGKVLDRLVELALKAKTEIARGSWEPSYRKKKSK